MATVLYVLPVHNEERLLRGNVERLCARIPAAEVFLVENGSSDASWLLCRELAGQRVFAFTEPSAGIGYAYDRGLREALSRHGPSRDHYAILTAADLPFGFSDLEAGQTEIDRGTHAILMGSKAHAASIGTRGIKRRAMSLVYRVIRRTTVGMRVGDSQGSVFVRLDLAAELVPKIQSRDFFYSTELCFFAERAGHTIVEMPVTLEEEKRKSTVRPFRDGRRMAMQLLELRSRS
jgi:dolichol-phosphate mannosyltransferase